MKIYIVRHGETEWNKLSKWQGSTDIPLNNTGHEQANAVAKEFTNKGIKKIYASPLIRAAATAEAIQRNIHVPLSFDEGLKEISCGKWEGLTLEEILESYNDEFNTWEEDPKAEIGLGVENYYNLQNRAFNTVKGICKKEDESIIIVTHGSWIRALMCKILNIPLNKRKGFVISNTSISILEHDKNNNEFGVLTLNSVSHLS